MTGFTLIVDFWDVEGTVVARPGHRRVRRRRHWFAVAAAEDRPERDAREQGPRRRPRG